jgi:hypothetical protein
MRIRAHRPIEKLNMTAMLFKLFQQYHLMHIVTRQPIRRGQEKPVNSTFPSRVSQMVQARTTESSAAIALVTKDELLA